jgi:hypothetical protein
VIFEAILVYRARYRIARAT